MEKLSFMEKVKLFAYNIKTLRVAWPPPDNDEFWKGQFRLRDLKYAPIGSWSMLIKALINKEYIPRAVVIVHAWISEKEMININNWAEKLCKENGW
jgi:hypothetical protein